MPVIRIDFDNEKVDVKEIQALSVKMQQIVSDVTKIEDVFVYANSAQVKVKIAPIEVFVEMSAHKIEDGDVLVDAFKEQLVTWKEETTYPHTINLSLIPMQWKIRLGI